MSADPDEGSVFWVCGIWLVVFAPAWLFLLVANLPAILARTTYWGGLCLCAFTWGLAVFETRIINNHMRVPDQAGIAALVTAWCMLGIVLGNQYRKLLLKAAARREPEAPVHRVDDRIASERIEPVDERIRPQ
jgi:hypothetical protein